MSRKATLIEQIILRLKQEFDTLMEAAKAAHQAATHEESKAEDQYDTRGLEASYLAGAQAARAAALEKQIAGFKFLKVRDFSKDESIAPGALVELEVSGRRTTVFLIPQGGGFALQVEGRTIQVITPEAPLGEALVGRKVGDVVEIEAQGAIREYEVCAIF